MPEDDVLVRSRPRVSALDFSFEEVTDFLKGRLRGRGVEEAYLFGSFAAGTQGAWSDVDLVIVKPSDLHPVERAKEFFDLLDLGLPVDILVYTPGEFAWLRMSGVGFWKEFEKGHVRLI